MAKRTEPAYYCPECGEQARYKGYYQCTGTGCGVLIEMRELVSADVAKRIRIEREVAKELTCDALF